MKPFTSLIFALTVLCIAGNASSRKVSTVAGAYVGDGKPATSAAFSVPEYAAIDGQGNIYVSDSNHCRLRKISVLGDITTLAGTGICGFAGDGGPAKDAELYFPSGIAVDAHGNVFFADAGSLRIRVVSGSGIIETVAGGGTYGFCGDGGPAKLACFEFPTAIAIGAGQGGESLYIADTYNNRVRQVNLSTGIITTIAGDGVAGYSGDGGLAVDASLDTPKGLAVSSSSHLLWISDTSNSAVRSVDTNTGIITTFFGNGTCGVTLCFPLGMSLDQSGNIYVSAVGNGDVIEIQVPSAVAIVKAGNGGQGYSGDGGQAVSALLNSAQDVLVAPAGNLLIVDSGNNRLRQVDTAGVISTIAGGGVGDGGISSASSVDFASGLAFDGVGNLYIADVGYNRIRLVTPAGTISTIAGTGLSGYTGDGGPATQAQLNGPSAVTADGFGNLYVGDYQNFALRKIDSAGIITTFASNVFANALASDSAGNIYVSDFAFCVIQKFTPSGQESIVAGMMEDCGYNGDGILATQAMISFPEGLVVDSSGNLYFTDMGNNRVRMVNAQGIISTIAGDGNCGFSGDGGPAKNAELCGPQSVGVDQNANLFIADAYNGRIRVVNSSLVIDTYAGEGGGGYGGNGLPALDTPMEPFPLAVNPAGLVYYGDIESYLVRRID